MSQRKSTAPVDRLSAGLVSEGLVTEAQLDKAKEKQKKTGISLGKVLVDLDLISQERLLAFIAKQLEIPDINLTSYDIDTSLIDMVSEATARKYKMIPLFKVQNTLTVAMANPLDVFALDDIRLQVGMEVNPAIASELSIEKAINEYYGGSHVIDEAAKNIDRASFKINVPDRVMTEKLERITEQPPIVKLVNEIIDEAVKQGASDIHIEPEKGDLRVRYRIDGALQKISDIPKHLELPVISRVKIMAQLDIAERRLPQDGRITVEKDGRDIDIRVSTFPSIAGEKISMRILDRGAFSLDLENLGLSSSNYSYVQSLIERPSGLLFVCGPTGCGKTTTLYSILNILNSQKKNIVTLEDPVEYEIDGINQGHIYPKKGLTFARGLRTILRQDPDIIMVGEVRDLETAELAVRAALTGHLVLSTMHTMDAVGAVIRLIDMGIEPYLIASALNGVLAQRLVRRICTKCMVEYTPTEETLVLLGMPGEKNTKFFKGKGCKECRHTGYKGRIGIYEVLVINDEIRKLIINRATNKAIMSEAGKAGLKTLMEDGLEKIARGITTVEEVLREAKTEE